MRHIKKFFEKAITKEDDIKDILIYLTDVGLEIKKQEIKWFDKRMKDFDSQYSFYYNFKSKFSGGQKSFLFSLSGSVSDEEDQISKTKEVMEALEQVKPRLEDYGKVYIKYHINNGVTNEEYCPEYDKLFIDVNITIITDELAKSSPVDEAAIELRKSIKKNIIKSSPEYGILQVMYEDGLKASQIEKEYSKIISILDKNFKIEFDSFYNNKILQFFVSEK